MHPDLASFPGTEKERRKGTWYTLFGHTRWRWRPCSYVYACILVTSWTCRVDVSVGVLFEWVSCRAVLWLLVAGYLNIKLKKEQVASNECIYRGNILYAVIH